MCALLEKRSADFTSAGLKHFRLRTPLIFTIPWQNAPGMPLRGIAPASPGLAQASLASRARRVPFLHRLISHGSVKNSEVPFLPLSPAPEYTGTVTFTPLIFHAPVSTRARHAASRHRPGFAGAGASFACEPGAEL
jgi:hypothetical protein